MAETLWQLAIRFMAVSLVAVGGATVIIPAVHADAVGAMHWLDDRAFTEIVAVSQVAPGPNILLLPLIGWNVAGWQGATVGLLAFLVPSGTLAVTTGRLLRYHGERPAFVLLRRAIQPIPVGLMIASGFILTKTAGFSPGGLSLTFAATAVALRWPKINPLWWIALAGLVSPFLHLSR